MAMSTPTLKYLFALSGNVCAFPECNNAVVEDGDDGLPVVVGEVAHIVGRSRQGPRGRSQLVDEERNSADNLILVCERHHKRIDADPRTYSVPVLRKIKNDHEGRDALPAGADDFARSLVTEPVTATVMSIEMLPALVYAAPTRARTNREVVSAFPSRARTAAPVIPFTLRDGVLLAFDDLGDHRSPCARSVDRDSVVVHTAQDMWADPDRRRWYVELLNKGLRLLLERHRGLVFDHDHRRFYFPHDGSGHESTVTLRTKTGRRQERTVVRPRISKRTGEPAEWWHEAVALRFEQFGPRSWGLTIRPEFYLTTDGHEPFPAKLVGRRVTRRKASIFNEQYYDRVHFWREHLTEGTPRFVLRFGAQAAVAAASLPAGQGTWPDIGDKRFDPAERRGDDLLSFLDYQQAVSGGFEWDDMPDDEPAGDED